MIHNLDYWAAPSPLSAIRCADRGFSVFCVDPGETTGWVWMMAGHHELEAYGGPECVRRAATVGRLKWGEINTWQCAEAMGAHGSLYVGEREMVNMLMVRIGQAGAASTKKLGRPFQVTHVCIEDFDLRSSVKTKNLLSPVRVTSGLLNELMSAEETVQLQMQSPSDKSVITDDNLISTGLWFAGMKDARAAARHLLLWLRRYQVASGGNSA